jgi:two-component system, chemotaxis family, CheB/CheR fusion protein
VASGAIRQAAHKAAPLRSGRRAAEVQVARKREPSGTARNFPVAGIGASAGGVQALQTFFDALPEQVGAALVVIVHLDPEHQSDMTRILAARTRMPVQQVDKPLALKPDNVYVIPPNRRLFMTDHEISVAEFSEPRGQRAPIDLFFRSLSEQHGEGFAIILTGAGSDGAVGVKAVKESGGVILVQDPNEAEYPSMPRSAIAGGNADFVLPVRELASQFVELVRSHEHLKAHELDGDDDTLRRILGVLRIRTGHDFSKYKRATVMRRIARRMQVAGLGELEDYIAYMRDNVDELQALFGDLLISVTNFFRDPPWFKELADLVVPRLFEGREVGQPIRVWVPGCATGEEAYSIAILLQEEAGRRHIRPELQLFATDLDGTALATAREGRYPTSIGADVSEDRLRRFFTKEGDHYRIKREVRDTILFAEHSLLKDPPFSRIDLISCRNLLIYLDRDLQNQVCTTFNYALVPNGYLFLGSSESVDAPGELFRPISREARIFQSNGRLRTQLPTLARVPAGIRIPEPPLAPASPRAVSPTQVATAHRQALEETAPPSVLVDQRHKLLHLSETAGRYLHMPAGQPTAEATDLVRPELRLDLRAALHRAFEQGEPSLSLPVAVKFNGKARQVSLAVRPVKRDQVAPAALVLFLEGGEASDGSPGGQAAGGGADQASQIDKLTDELFATRAHLEASREEYGAATEDLRAANEELQSINEEYRSTAEELETSKEELQSMNEELQTLNNELKLKLEAVSHAHNDLQNLMSATDVGTLFLDGHLHIKRFTPRVTELFNIKNGDEGRPITDFTHRLDYAGLVDDTHTVMQNLMPIEHEVRSNDERWFLMRLRPYRTLDDKIEGVILTFIDVTERRHAEAKLRDSETRLQVAREAAELGTLDYTTADQRLWCDARALALWGLDRDAAPTLDALLDAIHPDDRAAARAALDAALDPGGIGRYEAEFRVRPAHGEGERWIRAKGVTTPTAEDRRSGPRRLVTAVQDVTQRQGWEARQRLLMRELSHRVNNTLAVVQSIAMHSLRDSGAAAEAVAGFTGRVQALTAANERLVSGDWQGTDFASFAREQLATYVGKDPKRLQVEGPPVRLPAASVAGFGLLLHELATNAARYGALSTAAGGITLVWQVAVRDDATWLEVTWTEHGGPKVELPRRTGFGSVIIDQGLTNARVRRDFRPAGLVCTIEFRLAETSAIEPAMPKAN